MPTGFPLRLRLGSANAYLVPAQTGYVLIDTGDPGLTFLLFRALRQRQISPRQIRLIILTHIHYDHIGGLWAVQAASGAPVMVHEAEAADLAAGRVVIPAGTYLISKSLAALGQGASRFCRFPGYRADYVVAGDHAQPLQAFGLEGSIFHTPGHSPGSTTILLANGAAFVGDLCPNTWFNRWIASRFPPYADDVAAVYRSWNRLLSTPAQMLYPGHGPPYPAEELRRDRAITGGHK